MTDTKQVPEPVCRPGEDFTELVTVAEIGMVTRQLGVDPIGQVAGEDSPRRWEAMARLGWILDRRRDPRVATEVWDALTIPELLTALGVDAGETAEDREARQGLEREADAENPTVAPPG